MRFACRFCCYECEEIDIEWIFRKTLSQSHTHTHIKPWHIRRMRKTHNYLYWMVNVIHWQWQFHPIYCKPLSESEWLPLLLRIEWPSETWWSRWKYAGRGWCLTQFPTELQPFHREETCNRRKNIFRNIEFSILGFDFIRNFYCHLTTLWCIFIILYLLRQWTRTNNCYREIEYPDSR